jgi:enoyl-CoA hydratase/carnithine racemase
MSDGQILLERDCGIATITLSRPERRNAISAGFWESLRQRVIEAADDPPRALIITGAEGHFSAGLDIKPDNPLLARVLPVVQRKDADAARTLVRELKSVNDLVAGFPAPTIAAIEGACVGIGMELALACDLRVASSAAVFALPELQLGLVPDLGGTARLERLVGPGKAAMLTLACRRWTGTEAERAGAIELLCEPGQALELALALAADIRAGAPTGARGVLQVIRAGGDLDLADTLDLETEAGVNALLSGEPLEGLMARQARRAPSWNG